MLKKDAAVQVWGVASRLREYMKGDETIDSEVMSLMWIAKDLDPRSDRIADDYINWLLDESISVKVKLRNMIEHPMTSAEERDAAVRALNRLKDRDEA